jgi:hypothetical protein
MIDMILKKATDSYPLDKASERLTHKALGITYVATKRLLMSSIIQMPEKEQIRSDRIIPLALEKLILKIKDFLNYELERVVVKRVKKSNGKYEYVLFDGHHRFTAFSQLGYTHIVVDVIDVPKELSVFDIRIYKYILNDDYPKAGNSVSDVIKACKDEIIERFPQESKESSVHRKEVRTIIRDFVVGTKRALINKDRKIVEDALFSCFSSGKNAIKSGDIINWLSVKGLVKDPSNPSIVQNVMMGRVKNHSINIGYGGLIHLDDKDCVLENPIHICSTNAHTHQNLWELTNSRFTSRYDDNTDKIPPALFAFWVNKDCDGDLKILENEREGLQKYFYILREELAEAEAKKYVDYRCILGKKVSEKERNQIKSTFKRWVGNLGCIPQLDDEKSFVTSKGKPFIYPCNEDFYYA